jgi:hypothetical protein
MYKISNYSFEKAKELNVIIKPSTNPKKKIDVYKNNEKIATIGDIKYNDYTTYLKQNITIANKRRIAYKKRHEKDRNIKNSNGYFADQILW